MDVHHSHASTTLVMTMEGQGQQMHDVCKAMWYTAALVIVSHRCKVTRYAVTKLSHLKHPQPYLETQKPDIWVYVVLCIS